MKAQKNSPKVHISLVNWKRSKDTLECIDSLLKQRYSNIRIYIVDNGSGDDSIQNFIDYCEGKMVIQSPAKDIIRKTIGSNSIPKTYTIVKEENWTQDLFNSINSTIVILKNTKNYGFGYAHNQVMKFIAAQETAFSWILNNDTIVPNDAIESLINKLISTKRSFATPLLVYYDEPEFLQCDGTAKLYPEFGFAKMNHKLTPLANIKGKDSFKDTPYTFISGTALFIPSAFIREVGLFDEIFFMYAEDIDLSLRAKKLGWKPVVDENSFIFHKEGKSTAGRKHLFYEMYTRGNFILLQKHFSLFKILTAIPASILHTVLMGRFNVKNIWFTIRGIQSAFTVWKNK